jgi:hypothetical protein
VFHPRKGGGVRVRSSPWSAGWRHHVSGFRAGEAARVAKDVVLAPSAPRRLVPGAGVGLSLRSLRGAPRDDGGG